MNVPKIYLEIKVDRLLEPGIYRGLQKKGPVELDDAGNFHVMFVVSELLESLPPPVNLATTKSKTIKVPIRRRYR